jgi:hypothetical protein
MFLRMTLYDHRTTLDRARPHGTWSGFDRLVAAAAAAGTNFGLDLHRELLCFRLMYKQRAECPLRELVPLVPRTPGGGASGVDYNQLNASRATSGKYSVPISILL